MTAAGEIFIMHGGESWTEVLTRLGPLLEQIFIAYGIPPAEAQVIVEEACLVLVWKRPQRRDPEGWLLRTVVERCRRVAGEDEAK